MKERSRNLVDAKGGDGTFAGARKLYLERALRMTLLERLRAVEEMAESAKLIQQASARKRVER